ncbi:hypothetical protein Hdeb2414_s0019g00551131 [Helianthus debilis subsp. tardiflorus]
MRGEEIRGRGTDERRGKRRWSLSNQPITAFLFFIFLKKKKPIHLRGEWRHQIGVLGEFKRGVDVAHEDWFGVREGTHLLGEHPLHPYG